MLQGMLWSKVLDCYFNPILIIFNVRMKHRDDFASLTRRRSGNGDEALRKGWMRSKLIKVVAASGCLALEECTHNYMCTN